MCRWRECLAQKQKQRMDERAGQRLTNRRDELRMCAGLSAALLAPVLGQRRFPVVLLLAIGAAMSSGAL